MYKDGERTNSRLGRYEMINDFYILPMEETLYIELGVQWLHSLVDFSSNYQKLEMKFISHE